MLLEDFINPTSISSYELANETGGTLTVNHGSRRALLTNIVASPSTFFQTNFAPLGSGFDLTSYDFLDVRADRLGDFMVPGLVSFGIELVNQDGSRASSVAIDPYLVLGPPARSNLTLPTARVPLSAFDGAQLGAVRAVRFTFPTLSRRPRRRPCQHSRHSPHHPRTQRLRWLGPANLHLPQNKALRRRRRRAFLGAQHGRCLASASPRLARPEGVARLRGMRG